MTTKTMKEKATELLQRCEVVTLASVNKEGYPRPVPMSKILAEGISTIWMSTGADSLKTIDFLSNPKAGLCFQDKGDSVALTGKVEVVTDEKMKQELWQDWFIDHFEVKEQLSIRNSTNSTRKDSEIVNLTRLFENSLVIHLEFKFFQFHFSQFLNDTYILSEMGRFFVCCQYFGILPSFANHENVRTRAAFESIISNASFFF